MDGYFYKCMTAAYLSRHKGLGVVDGLSINEMDVNKLHRYLGINEPLNSCLYC